MAKDPVLPLYYNDISGATQTWSDEEFGAYVRLLIHQWRDGGLPKDYQRLTRISTSLDKNWPMLKSKFPEVDGVLKNPVMEEIREKRNIHKQKQKENVQKRYQKSTKQDTKNIPLEEEKEIEIEIDIELNIKGAFDEIYIEDQKMKWSHLDFNFEYRAFCEKVRGSPAHYKNHDTGGLRLAFQKQLRESKNKKNGHSKDKREQHIESLATDFATKYGGGNPAT